MVVEPLLERGLILVSGPSRGGKSAWAEHLAQQYTGGPVLYLATGPGTGSDPSWSERVARHQDRRPDVWQALEVGPELIEQLRALVGDGDPPPLLLIDSLGTWLAWHLDDTAEQWDQRCDQLIHALVTQRGPVVLVVEETGWGVVPATAVGGLFRDRMGALQQLLMQHCHTAWLVVAGRAINLIEYSFPVPPA
jgi:adenosylcobinamide kinase/adenosylcobinamide-phosphate guanylyltransferase